MPWTRRFASAPRASSRTDVSVTAVAPTRQIRPGVSAVIVDDEGRVLLQQRTDNGAWGLPGGAVEFGESVLEALHREVREETGLEIRPLGVLEIFERIMHDASGATEYHYVLVDYICRITGGELHAGDDVAVVEWVRRRDLPKLQITEGTLAVIEKGFRERRRYR